VSSDLRAALRTALAGHVGASVVAAVGIAALVACSPGDRPAAGRDGRATTDSAVSVVDATGRTLRLPRPPRRVVSLVPSATDIIVGLGATAQLVGRTRYDTDRAVAHLPSVGGGLDPSLETLLSLRPDVVIVWGTDGPAATRSMLEQAGVATFAARSEDTTDVFTTTARLGHLLGLDSTAVRLSERMRAELAAVRRSVAGRPSPTVFYVVATTPPTTAGPATFIGQLVEVAGGRLLFSDVAQLWPTVAIEEIVRRQPDVVVLPRGEDALGSPDALRGIAGWRELRAVREGRVVTVPAELMNRPGPRIGEAAALLRDALHPEVGRR
jgi:iron complex transport system substrate-binding protein